MQLNNSIIQNLMEKAGDLRSFSLIPLEQESEMIVIGERLSKYQTDKDLVVARKSYFSERLVNLQIFEQFSVLVLKLGICLFSDVDLKKKQKPEKTNVALIKNRGILQKSCEPVFKNPCLIHETCKWVFEESVPESSLTQTQVLFTGQRLLNAKTHTVPGCM